MKKSHQQTDRAPGDEEEISQGGSARIWIYGLGFVLSLILTGASFWAARTGLIYAPAVPYALAALAIGQMGVHLVFFFRITSAPNNTNNIIALGFGVMVTFLIIFGSQWIMAHLHHRTMPMEMENTQSF